jgi:hypothetical protein
VIHIHDVATVVCTPIVAHAHVYRTVILEATNNLGTPVMVAAQMGIFQASSGSTITGVPRLFVASRMTVLYT